MLLSGSTTMHTPTHAPLSIPVHRVGAGQAFHFDIQPFIHNPAEHPIRLISPVFSWFHVTPQGQVIGASPETNTLLQYWISLDIDDGATPVRTGFLLQIVPLHTPTMTIPRIPVPMLHPVDPNMPHTRDLLDYIFHYFDAFAKDEWAALLKDEAKKRGKALDTPIKDYEFKELITAINPLAEKQLREKSQTLQALTLAELRSDEFINLFRQGSQPLGSVAIVVFNYLAAPDQHNWSHVKNVLDFAADELIELMEHNQVDNNLHVIPKKHT